MDVNSDCFNSTWTHLKNDLGRNLNHYIEAQIHGGIVLNQHIERVVCDPSFCGTETADLLEQLNKVHGVPVVWHRGFVCAVGDVPSNYRGGGMPVIAKDIAEHQSVTASTIGKAAASFTNGAWEPDEQLSSRDILQELKCLWHVLVKFGKPIR